MAKTKAKLKFALSKLLMISFSCMPKEKQKRFEYSPDSFLQHELEASFMYEDTPDQYKATQAVKDDMEKASQWID